MDTNDKKQEPLQIHIVSSVKGGCGKTAFSLFKAMEIALEERKRIVEEKVIDKHIPKSPVLLIDADFKGTGSKVLFYGKDKDEFQGINKGCSLGELEAEAVKLSTSIHEEPADIYEKPAENPTNLIRFSSDYVSYTINDYLRGDIRELERMIVHAHMYTKKEYAGSETVDESKVAQINGFLDFIFSSPNVGDKKIFQYGGSLPTVEIGQFTHYMQRILMEIYEMGSMNTKAEKGEINVRADFGYKHIVLDMSPGDDAYSEALLNMIYRWNESLGKDKVKINYYLLTTSDRGHRDTVVRAVSDVKDRLRNFSFGEDVNVSVVLSEIREKEFEDSSVQQSIVYDLKNEAKILKFFYQPEYYYFCRNGLGRQIEFVHKTEEVN